MRNQQKNQSGNSGINNIAKALTGAAVGAGIVAGAVALSDEKRRGKVKKMLIDVKNKIVTQNDDIKADMSHKKDKVLKELKEEVESKKAEIKAVAKTVKEGKLK